MGDRLWNKNFSLLVSGYSVSQLGSFIYSTAIILVLKEMTDSAMLIGLNSMMALAPTALFGIFAGTVVDHSDKKLLMVLTDMLRGAAMLLLAFLAFLSFSNLDLTEFTFFGLSSDWLKLNYWTILLVTLFVGFNTVLFDPAINSLLPDTLDKDNISRGNSVFQSVGQITQVVGFPLGGILFTLFGGPWIFAVNGVSFILSGVANLFIDSKQKGHTETRTTLRTLLSRTKEGLAYSRSVKGLVALILILVLTNSLFPPFLLSLPFYIENVLHLSNDYYGYFLGAMGIGAVFGSIVFSVFTVPNSARFAAFLSGFVAILVLSVTINFPLNTVLVFLEFGLFGFANMTINVILTTSFQEKIDPDFRGRFWGLLLTAEVISAPLSFLVSGIVIDMSNKEVGVIFGSIAFLLFLSTTYCIVTKGVRSFLAVK